MSARGFFVSRKLSNYTATDTHTHIIAERGTNGIMHLEIPLRVKRNHHKPSPAPVSRNTPEVLRFWP